MEKKLQTKDDTRLIRIFRKWNRILHRDIGFFFIGTSLIYGLSGIALNHLKDWNPSYTVNYEDFATKIDLKKGANNKSNILQLLEDLDLQSDYKTHAYRTENELKIYLKGGSTIVVNTETGEGSAEFLKKRPLFYEVNYLHYNPNVWWKWFSDIFAVALIFLAFSSLFMIKGRKGIWGRGGIYTVLGILIPILFLIFF